MTTDGDAQTSSLEAEVGKALEPFAEALRSDGYKLGIAHVAADAIELKIEALEGACEDCLVPEHVMAPMIQDALPPSLRSATVHIEYPTHNE